MRTLTEIHFVSGEKVLVTESLDEVLAVAASAVQKMTPIIFTHAAGGQVLHP